MRLRLVRAVLADGVRGAVRGRGLSAAAIFVIGLTFSVSVVALLLADSIGGAVQRWSRPDMLRVYLEEGGTVQLAEALAATLRERDGVEEVEVLSPEEVRESFATDFPEMADLARVFADSPFPPELRLDLAPSLPAVARAELAREIESAPGVAAALGDDLWAGRLTEMAGWIRLAGRGAGLFHALLAALVVSGVVRLSLASRREEMATMAVVGAPRLFIAGPLVVEGFILGGLGGGLALAAAWSGAQAAAVAAQESPLAPFLALQAPGLASCAALIGLAGVAGAAGALWTARRELTRL